MALTGGANLTTLSAIMKEFYLGPVQNQFNNEVLVTQVLGVDSENLEGLKAVIPLHTGRSGGIMSRGEGVQFQNAGSQGYKRAEYDLKYHYARIQVTGPSISKTKSDAGAFLQAIKSELDYIKDDVMLDFARQLYGDGTGAIATIAAATPLNPTVWTLTSDEALQKGFIYIGMFVDVGTLANPTLHANNLTVSDVDVSALTFTTSVAGTGDPAGGEFVFRAGNCVAGPLTYEIDAGLQKIISTSANTVGNINAGAAGNRIWDNQRNTSGGAVTLQNLMIEWNKVANAGGKSGDYATTTTPGLVRRIFELAEFKSNVRFINTQTLRGGFEEITFNAGGGNLKLIADRLHPYGKIFFIPKKHLRLFSPADWDFLSRDGLTIRWVPDHDAFQSVLFRYANLGTDRRNTSSVLSGLTDTGF